MSFNDAIYGSWTQAEIDALRAEAEAEDAGLYQGLYGYNVRIVAEIEPDMELRVAQFYSLDESLAVHYGELDGEDEEDE